MLKVQNKKNFINGVKDSVPVALAYLAVSFALGVSASNLGLKWFVTVIMSMTNLTSAGQLAGLNIIAACGTILEMILTQLVINARYFLMSITLTQKLDGSFTFGHRLLCSAFVTDEIFAIAAAKPKTFGRKYFYGLVILPYVGWTLGTLLGASAGSILPDFIINALGIALYAMFVAIILPPSITTRGVLPAVALGAGISCAIYFIPAFSNVSTGIAIIISAVISALVIAAIFPIKDKEQER